jgi:hypothetical protein
MLNTYLNPDDLVFSPAIQFGNLAMVPIINKLALHQDFICLDEAIKTGVAQITEISEGGSVPKLQFLNHGSKPVLLLDGEELIGAKQNRVLNLTILAPAFSRIVIPVSCVEAGRWNWRSRHFNSADRTLFAEARVAKMAQVTRSMRSQAGYASDQRAVWDSIADKSARFNVHSGTSAASDIFEHRFEDLDKLVSQFPACEKQTGAAFFVRGKLAGVELFGDQRALAHLLPKLVRSYGLDSLDESIHLNSSLSDVASASGFLQNVLAAPGIARDAIGMGEDIRLESGDLLAAALVSDGALIHLSAFVQGYGLHKH